MKLALSPKLEGVLAAAAEEAGLSPQDLARVLLAEALGLRGTARDREVPECPFVDAGTAPALTRAEENSLTLSLEEQKEEEEQKQEDQPKPKRRKRDLVVEPPPLPIELASVEGLPAALLSFAEYRREKRKPLTAYAWKLLYNALARHAGENARLAVLYVMARGWLTWDPEYTSGKGWGEIAALLGEAPSAPVPAPSAPPPSHPVDPLQALESQRNALGDELVVALRAGLFTKDEYQDLFDDAMEARLPHEFETIRGGVARRQRERAAREPPRDPPLVPGTLFN